MLAVISPVGNVTLGVLPGDSESDSSTSSRRVFDVKGIFSHDFVFLDAPMGL